MILAVAVLIALGSPLQAATSETIPLKWIGDVPLEGWPRLRIDPSSRDILLEKDRDGSAPTTAAGPSFALSGRGLDLGQHWSVLTTVISVDPGFTTLTLTRAPDTDGIWRVGSRVVAEKSGRVRTANASLAQRGDFPGPRIKAEDAAFRTPDGVRFEDGKGNPVRPDVYLSGVERLFAIAGDQRLEIMSPDDREAQSLYEFWYDPIARRILTTNGIKSVLYDLREHRRRILWAFDRPTHRRLQYHLIPGRDALILYEYIETEQDPEDPRLFLCDLDGRKVSRISLGEPPGAPGCHLINPKTIVCSEHVIAYTYRRRDSILRVYAIRPDAP
jgi:hypothetical protein